MNRLFAPAFILALALLFPPALQGGEPIPEIDVILEQNPGGTIVESSTGGLDEIILDVGREFAAALSAKALRAGWTLETEGKTVRLAGPKVPVGQPVRFKLDTGDVPRPQKISYQVRLEGRTLLRRRNGKVELVPPRKVIGSLQGIVTMPTRVAPGEPMQMRISDSAALPAGGTWRLTGTVTSEESVTIEEEEVYRIDEGGPEEPIVVTFKAGGEVELANPRFANEFPVAYERIERFAADFAPSIEGGSPTRLTIGRDSSLEWDPIDAGPQAETAEALLIDETATGGELDPVEDAARQIPVCRWWRPIPPQCRIKQPKPRCPNGFPRRKCTHFVSAFALADGTVDFELPEDLAPGGKVALQYVDIYGDLVIDVPSVPGIEVVEPMANEVARITAATPRALAGQQVCVCGSFPGPDAWNGLLLDGEALGSPVSASSRMAWVQLPTGLGAGEHVVTGAPEPGFPVGDRAEVVVVEVAGELDSSKLRRLETTPMRLWVIGTSEAIDLRVRNKTPSIISIEGGADQVIRTSGGEPNMLERSVQGLSPGAFDIEYELAGAGCPCAAMLAPLESCSDLCQKIREDCVESGGMLTKCECPPRPPHWTCDYILPAGIKPGEPSEPVDELKNSQQH